MPDPSEPILEARDLVRTFPAGSALRPTRVSAVDRISLSLHPGEVLGVVGESGCGKSTLARMLVGLDRPDSGNLTYRGVDVTEGKRSHRRLLHDGVQMIFQDPFTSLDPRMTVGKLIAEPLAASGRLTAAKRRTRVAELLGLVGLSADMMSRFPHQFSGGQRQRIGIARALTLEPDVLVCDEPVSALDVSVQAQVINLLDDLRQRLGVAVVFIAHDLAVVRHIADRVVVMYLGRVAEAGQTEAVFTSTAHPYSVALLSANPSLEVEGRGQLSKRQVLQGEPPSPIDPPPGCRFHPRCWMAIDLCRTEDPQLRHPDSPVADAFSTAACHRSEDLLDIRSSLKR